MGQFNGNPDINNGDFSLGLSGQCVNGGSLPKKIVHHLRRYNSRIGAHALSSDAMVSGHDNNCFERDNGQYFSGDTSHLNSNGFQLPKAASWFR